MLRLCLDIALLYGFCIVRLDGQCINIILYSGHRSYYSSIHHIDFGFLLVILTTSLHLEQAFV